MRSLLAFLLLLCALPIAVHAGPVDINTADAATLARELKGIGPARAAAIIEYRNAHGPFKNVDELGLVSGIGQKVIDDNREMLRVGPAGKPAAPAKAAAGAKTAAPVKAAPPAKKPPAR